MKLVFSGSQRKEKIFSLIGTMAECNLITHWSSRVRLTVGRPELKSIATSTNLAAATLSILALGLVLPLVRSFIRPLEPAATLST